MGIEIVLNWLMQNVPWLAPTIVVGLLLWPLSRWTKDVKDTKEKVDALKCSERQSEIKEAAKRLYDVCEKVNNSPCGKHASDIKEMNQSIQILSGEITKLPCEKNTSTITSHKSSIDIRLASLESHFNDHKQRLTSVETKLTRWDEKMMDLAFSSAFSAQKNSPYSVTPYGEYLLEKSFGKECIDDNREKFFALIDEQPHTTPYDIERAALGIVMDAFRTDDTNSVKNFIYNSPAEIEFNGEPHNLSTTDIQVAMAIYLRDLYLERNKEIGQLSAPIVQEDQA